MFYLRLALINLRKNKVTYFPYLIAFSSIVAINVVIQLLITNPVLMKLTDSMTLMSSLSFGRIIIWLFTLIFMSYINRFLVKQRQSEFGLYHVLGLGKRELLQVIGMEYLCGYVIAIVVGLLGGLIFSRFSYLILQRLFQTPPTFYLTVDWIGLGQLILGFLGLTACMLGRIAWRILRLNPLAFFTEQIKGEKEPRSHWLAALVGLLCLVSGYFLAWKVQSAVLSIFVFFLAVVLVIMATYNLFFAGSVLLLKGLQRWKSFYYQPQHFIVIGNMMYRIRRNALGLASICILSTMALVTIITTSTMYFGRPVSIERNYPNELEVSMNTEASQVESLLHQTSFAHHVSFSKQIPVQVIHAHTFRLSNTGIWEPMIQGTASFMDYQTSFAFTFIDLASFNRLTNKTYHLRPKQVLLIEYQTNFPQSTLTLSANQTFQVIKKREHTRILSSHNPDSVVIVVPSTEQLQQLVALWQNTPSDTLHSVQQMIVIPKLRGTLPNQEQFQTDLMDRISQIVANGTNDKQSVRYFYQFKQDAIRTYQAVDASLFFIGVLLGTVFLLAAVLIIYYKQIAEGFEDRERYKILQEVGMDDAAIQHSIRSQVALLFAFPLFLALVHVFFAYPIIQKILALLEINNATLYFYVTLFVSICYGGLYVSVYLMTSRTYYQIIRKND